MRGYSQIIIEMNQKAKPTLGVQLGTMCIALKYPVSKVAIELGISRQSVYDWFSGRSVPAEDKEDAIKALAVKIAKERSEATQ